MEPDPPAAVAYRDNTTVRAASGVHPGFNAQNEAGPGCRNGADMDALDTEQCVRARAPATAGTRHRVIQGLSLNWLLGRYQFREALTSFPPHHAANEKGLRRGVNLRPP
jgi:hypothetical protein